jgi:hypothetical protein
LDDFKEKRKEIYSKFNIEYNDSDPSEDVGVPPE